MTVPKMTIRRPGEMAEMVPFLLGFTPQESLVIVVIESGRVAVTARLDLRDAARTPQLARQILARFPGASVALLAYSETPQWGTLNLASEAFPSVVFAALVVGDTWYTESESGALSDSSAVVAEAVYNGLQRVKDRAEVEDSFTPGTQKIGSLPENAAGLASDLFSVDPAILAALASYPVTRDVMLLAITRENAEHYLKLWKSVVRTMEPSEEVYFMAGMAAWISGDGAAMNVAVDRITALNPDSTRACLLIGLIDAVMPPSEWDGMRESLKEQVGC